MASIRDLVAHAEATQPISLRAALVRRRIVRGTYHVDLGTVAARLLDALDPAPEPVAPSAGSSTPKPPATR